MTGGVPVAAAMAHALGWPLDVAVVSKVTLPWNTESGYGAVAFDGSVLLVEKRTQSDSYNVFTVDPSRTPQAPMSGPGTGNAQSP